MKTIIKGMQVTNVEINKNCRATHGIEGALQEAYKMIGHRYLETVKMDINKGATFNLTLTLDR